jgi:hypothetical protein
LAKLKKDLRIKIGVLRRPFLLHLLPNFIEFEQMDIDFAVLQAATSIRGRPAFWVEDEDEVSWPGFGVMDEEEVSFSFDENIQEEPTNAEAMEAAFMPLPPSLPARTNVLRRLPKARRLQVPPQE